MSNETGGKLYADEGESSVENNTKPVQPVVKPERISYYNHKNTKLSLAKEYAKRSSAGRFQSFRDQEVKLLAKAMLYVGTNDDVEKEINGIIADNEGLSKKTAVVSAVKTYKKLVTVCTEPCQIITCNKAQERLIDPKNFTESFLAKPRRDCSNPSGVRVLLKAVGRRSMEDAFHSRSEDLKNELEWRTQLRTVNEATDDNWQQRDTMQDKRMLLLAAFRK